MRHRFATLVIVTLIATAAASTAAVAAQEPATRPLRGSGVPIIDAMLERTRAAVDDLKLSAAQQEQVDAILEKAETDLASMKAELESMNFRERAQEVRQFSDGLGRDVAQVLTPAQREQIAERIERGNERGRGRTGQGGRGGRGGRETSPKSPAITGTGGPPRQSAEPPAGGPEQQAERLRQNLRKLDLSDEQKARLQALFQDLRDKGEALRAEMATAAPDVREKARALAGETRERVAAILTPEQRKQLRDLMGPPPAKPDERPRPTRTGAGAPPGAGDKRDAGQKMEGDAMMSDGDQMMTDGMTGGAAAGQSKRGVDSAPDQPLSAGPSVGDVAPELALPRLDGSRLQLSALKGRVIVLVFGSYSSPSFRNRAAALDQLKTEHGGAAQFFIVYTREAHPAGIWEVARNRDAGISVEQPGSDEARKALAQEARAKLALSTPIALDAIGNDAAIAYGAGANSAYVIGRDGRIAARQQWFEPLALSRAIDKAIQAEPTKAVGAAGAAGAGAAAAGSGGTAGTAGTAK